MESNLVVCFDSNLDNKKHPLPFGNGNRSAVYMMYWLSHHDRHDFQSRLLLQNGRENNAATAADILWLTRKLVQMYSLWN